MIIYSNQIVYILYIFLGEDDVSVELNVRKREQLDRGKRHLSNNRAHRFRSVTKQQLLIIMTALSLLFLLAFIAGQVTSDDYENNILEDIVIETSNVTEGDCPSTFFWNRLRLPEFALPQKYKIYIHFDMAEFKFEGDLQLKMTIKNATDRLILHSRGLTISNFTIAPFVDGIVVPVS